MGFIILYLLIGLINKNGNAISEVNEESKEGSLSKIEKTSEEKNTQEKYDPFSHVYVFKYDLEPLVEEERNYYATPNQWPLSFSKKDGRSDPDERYPPNVITKQVSGRRKADIKYLENLMAHPSWFTVFTMDDQKDYHPAQVKYPLLKNIENIQEFYKKYLGQTMCTTAKQYSHEPYASNPSFSKTLEYLQNPYYRFNESEYDKALYRSDIRKKIQQKDEYRTYGGRWFNDYNRYPIQSCTKLPVRNRWILQPKNVAEEMYEPDEISLSKDMYSTEKNVIENNNYTWSDFPENYSLFVYNPAGIDSNIKNIFGQTNNTKDEDYPSARNENGGTLEDKRLQILK